MVPFRRKIQPLSIMIFSIFVFNSCMGFQTTICKSNESLTSVDLSEVKMQISNAYQYDMEVYSNAIEIICNENGTKYSGNLSKIMLKNRQNKLLEYYSESFEFKYPGEHRLRNLTEETIEIQITHRLSSKQRLLKSTNHQYLVLSVVFILSEFAPITDLTLHHTINPHLHTGHHINLNNIIKILPNMPVILYKGNHPNRPNDSNVLWMVRKEINIMSFEELDMLRKLIGTSTNKTTRKKTSAPYIIQYLRAKQDL